MSPCLDYTECIEGNNEVVFLKMNNNSFSFGIKTVNNSV